MSGPHISRRSFLQTSAGAALSFAAMVNGCGKKLPERPNFVFVLVDDLGWMDTGCYGGTFYETPNVDRLAREGMRFTDAYAACPVCSPTRASIMTGKYPARVGITDWIPGFKTYNKDPEILDTPEDLHQLPLEENTIAEALKRAGYSTFFAGKWHLGSEGYLPDSQGFDINLGGNHTGQPFGGYFSPYSNPQLTDGPEGEYLTDRLGDESVAFLESHAHDESPFLLYLSFYTVHTPIQPKDNLQQHYADKLAAMENPPETAFGEEGEAMVRLTQDDPDYAAMVNSMDENLGKVLDALDRLELADNTVVIFMSDNGGLSTAPWEAPTSNVPLRAGKGWLYEGGIREPMIVRWPGVVKPETTCSVPVTSTDFYPTMLEMSGQPLVPKQHADGLSLMPLLKGGKKLDREAIYWHFPHYHGSRSKPAGAVRAGDWKLIEFFEDDKLELYNLKDDIGERRDLAQEKLDKVTELHDMMKAWRVDVGAKMPTKVAKK